MEAGEFKTAATKDQNRGLVRELIGLVNTTKKWWLAPVIIVMLLIGLLAILSGSAAAPFIYTLF